MTKAKAGAARRAAAKHEAAGSVHEAIGTLLGDDAARADGKAKQAKAAAAVPDTKTSAQD